MKKVSLEGILREYFGCKKPVLKNPKKFIDFDGYESKQYMSDAGYKAYAKLVALINDLNKLTDYEYDLYGLIEDLDMIVDEDVCYNTMEDKLYD